MDDTQAGPRVLAVDVGGTKLAAAVVAADGSLLASGQAPTPPRDVVDAEGLYAVLEALCRRVLAEGGGEVAVVGVGSAGPMRYPEGEVSPLNMPAWRGFPLRVRLATSFGRPCVVDNDAKAVALGEHWLGAGRGASTLLGMVVSTGVGGGVIADGRLVHGHSGNAGHFGHVVVWPDGPPCLCGARGCVEAIASGTSIARRLAAAQDAGEPTTLPRGVTAAEVAAAARAGDPLARRLFREAGQAVGRGIASATALLDLERVIIGGSVALRAWDLLGPPLLAEIERSARLDFARGVEVRQAGLGDRAGLLGAAALGLRALRGDD